MSSSEPERALRALTKKWMADRKACCRPGEFKCSSCLQQHKDTAELERLIRQLYPKSEVNPAVNLGE